MLLSKEERSQHLQRLERLFSVLLCLLENLSEFCHEEGVGGQIDVDVFVEYIFRLGAAFVLAEIFWFPSVTIDTESSPPAPEQFSSA